MADTAPSWDSFKGTLIKILAEFKPSTVLEWGPGTSTLIMQDFPSINLIDTIEHDVAWYGKWINKFGTKVRMTLESDLTCYPNIGRRLEKYDLYFVDGRERERCLDSIEDGIVILHDAERESYQSHIKMFKHIFMEDGGHTCVMTNNDDYAKRMDVIFADCGTRS